MLFRRGNKVMAAKYRELEQMTDEELISQYDQTAVHTSAGLSFLQDELARRKNEKESMRMLKISENSLKVAWISLIVTIIFSIITAALTVFQLFGIPSPNVPITTDDTPTTTDVIESETAFIWVEGNGSRFVDENGLRIIGVNYLEVNLSELTWDGQSWDELGPGIEPLSDLTQVFGQSITTRDEVAHVVDAIMVSEQRAGNKAFADAIGISRVQYDSSKGIWIAEYWQDRPGSDLSVAVDGKSGELIRIWASGE